MQVFDCDVLNFKFDFDGIGMLDLDFFIAFWEYNDLNINLDRNS